MGEETFGLWTAAAALARDPLQHGELKKSVNR